MAEYFESRLDAERFMHEWFAKDQSAPVFFGKILNHGTEKSLVNYDARQNPRSSPYIQVLADHCGEIRGIVSAPWEQRKQELEAEEQRRREQQRRDEEKRARDAHVAEARRQRAAAGRCTQCGRPLGFLGSVLRRDRHRGCKQFVD